MNGVIATWMLTALVSAAPHDSGWHNDYSQALAAAKADRKPLLVVLHNPEQPQQALRQVAYQKSDATSLLDNYHLCQVDVTTANGKRVASLFRPTAYPYTVITDRSANKIIMRKGGAFTDAQWTETLANYRRGARPVSMASFAAPTSSYGGDFCPT